MTHRRDVAFSPDIMARWCALAEQRLEHLTELFESGRWRRYHSERAFLENIQEAKQAVEIWRDLSTLGYVRGLSSRRSALLDDGVAAMQASQRQPDPVAMEGAPAVLAAPPEIDPAPPATIVEFVPRDRMPPVPPPRVVEFTLDIDGVKERYPLLRNVF